MSHDRSIGKSQNRTLATSLVGLLLLTACSRSQMPSAPSPTPVAQVQTPAGGPAPAALPCTIDVPAEQRARTVPKAGSSFDVSVTGDTNCAWTATSSADFVVLSEASGSGPAVFKVEVRANSGPSRVATVTVGAVEVTITQDSGEAPLPPPQPPTLCMPTISVADLRFTYVAVPYYAIAVTNNTCSWKATTTSSFITLNVFEGNAVQTLWVSLALSENTGTTDRTGTIHIGGQQVTVTQMARRDLGPTGPLPSPPPGASTFLVYRSDYLDSQTLGQPVTIVPGTPFVVTALPPNVINISVPSFGSLRFSPPVGTSWTPGVYEPAMSTFMWRDGTAQLNSSLSGLTSTCPGRFEVAEVVVTNGIVERFHAKFVRRCPDGTGFDGEIGYVK